MEHQTSAAFAFEVVAAAAAAAELVRPQHHGLCGERRRLMNHPDFSQLLCASQVLNSYWVGA